MMAKEETLKMLRVFLLELGGQLHSMMSILQQMDQSVHIIENNLSAIFEKKPSPAQGGGNGGQPRSDTKDTARKDYAEPNQN